LVFRPSSFVNEKDFTMQIIQIGCGTIGRELASQVLAQGEHLLQRYGITLEYRALVDSSGVISTGTPLSAETVQSALANKAAGTALAHVPGGRSGGNWLELLPNEPCIVVDCTAADGMEQPLAEAVRAGHRVVLANKRPLTAALASFAALVGKGATRYEATVGAGLPVISTLQGLIDSGDELVRVEASMSGTLGYLFSELESGLSFSKAVRAAHKKGYTEPDPRDDLGGADVARKALIIARTCGLAWEADAVAGEALFPATMAEVSVQEFMAELEKLDAYFDERMNEAHSRGRVVRYVATLTPEGASVGPQSFPASHPLASLRGPDNLFSIMTSRYSERPLVVRGPGAGVAVTAAGVLGDIVATAREGRE
jgi:homoserine dehydrogenase